MTDDSETPPWVRPLDASGTPRYLQIVRLIETALDGGLLRPGDRLPPQRSLARTLGVDLTTITRAYDEARRRNLLDAVTGRGSFVSANQEHAGPPIDLGMNIPPPPNGLRLGELMRHGLDEVLARSSADMLMTYRVGAGSKAERAAGAAWLAPLLGPVDLDRIVVAAGAQPALVALLTRLAAPGDTLLVEPLTYPGLLAAARQRGLKCAPVEADDQGMRPDALEAAARTTGATVVCLTPTIHNPTTVTMGEARRRDIVDVADRLGLRIVEDDPYALLASDAPPPFAALAPQLTHYVSTLSKVLTPGLRTAYVVLPPGTAPDDLVAGLRTLTQMPAPLMTALATHWIRIGAAQDLLDGIRREAVARQTLARTILPPTARAHPEGLHVWLPLPLHWDRYRLIDAVRREGLGVTPSDAFCVAGRAPDAIRISLGGVGERSRLASALRIIADTVGGEPVAATAVV